MNTHQEETILNIINETIYCFNIKESYLIKNNLSERCICAKFAHYLEVELSKTKYKDYNVDVEYNRTVNSEGNIKTLEDKNIIVDLIIHKRGTNDNLVCIEMKKSCDGRNIPSDEERLKKLTKSQYGFSYKIGVMLLIERKEKRGVFKLLIKTVFKNGLEIKI